MTPTSTKFSISNAGGTRASQTVRQTAGPRRFGRGAWLSVLAIALFTAPGFAQTVLRVDAGASTGGNGLSWATAYRDLQDALTTARNNPAAVSEVWVAAGVYHPDQGLGISLGDRTASFTLVDGVSVYGGFSGDETERSAREPATHVTILSGDLDDDGVTIGDAANTFRVVDASGTGNDTVLDGFTITGGNADSSSTSEGALGGGVYIFRGDCVIRNCIIDSNHAYATGGGFMAEEGSPSVVACVFRNNTTDTNIGTGGGAIMSRYGSSVTVINTLFEGNVSDYGGAIEAWHGAVTAVNCTFVGNHGTFSGGAAECSYEPGFSSQRSDLTLINCITWGNTAGLSGSQLAQTSGMDCTVAVSFGNIEGGMALIDLSGGGSLEWDAATNLSTNPLFAAGSAQLSAESPCIDRGTNDAVTETLDLAGSARIGNSGGGAIVDMGAYEYHGECDGNGMPPGITPMDWDDDGDVDLADYNAFFGCLSGPSHDFDGGCVVFDFDGDCDIDLTDYEAFQTEFTAIQQDPPTLWVSPPALSMGSTTVQSMISVENHGAGTLGYTVSGNAGWLTVTPLSGSVTTETDLLTVTVDRTGLPEDTYQAEVTVTPNTGSAIVVLISMTVGGCCGTDAGLASREEGVAPLAVFFDATEAGSGVVQPPGGDYAAYHYKWDFGDPAAGAWATNGQSRNEATGYIAAHVFEHPGSYTVTLRVTAPDGSSFDYTRDIEVTDPATAPGWTTYYVAANGSNTNDGLAPSRPLKTFATAMTKTGTRRRILFRRGDVFPTSTSATITAPGPGIIGSYGDAGAPRPVIDRTGSSDVFGLRARDWRIMDLELDGDNNKGSGEGIDSGSAVMVDTLVYRMHIHGFYMGLWNTFFPEPVAHNHNFVVDCEINNQGNKGIFFGGQRLAFLGNHMHDTASHILRVWHGVRCVISENTLRDPHSSSAAVVKYHNADNVSSGLPDGRFVIISDNRFRGHTWDVTVGTQDDESYEVVRDVVIERNFVESSPTTQLGLRISAQNVTLRNNLGDFTGIPWDAKLIAVTRWGIEPPPTGARVYNNAAYRSDSGGLSLLADYRSDTMVHNNVAYSPAGGAVIGGSGGNFAANLTANPLWVDPANGNFRLTPGSPAVDAGTSVPVLDDWEGNTRPLDGDNSGSAQHDIGPYEYVP